MPSMRSVTRNPPTTLMLAVATARKPRTAASVPSPTPAAAMAAAFSVSRAKPEREGAQLVEAAKDGMGKGAGMVCFLPGVQEQGIASDH